MKLTDVWAHTEQCIAAFEALPETACVTEDEHIEGFILPLTTHGKATAEEATFIRETTSGVIRYRAFLDATVAGYCAALKKNKQNGTSIAMLYYLALFRFEELGPEALRRILNKTLSHNRLAEMLELLLDEARLRQHIVPRWCTVFDDIYVERQVLGTLRRVAPELGVVAAWFREKASGTAAGAGTVKSGAQRTTAESVAGFGETQYLGDDHLVSPGGPSTMDGTLGATPPRGGAPPEFKLFRFQQREDTRAKKPPLPPAEVRALEALGQREEFPKIAAKCRVGEARCVELTKKGVRGATTLDPEVREANRQRERKIPFREFSSTARPQQLPKLLEEARLREEDAMRPVTTDRPSPERVRERIAAVRDRVDVRQTDAALRREFNLYKQREVEEERRQLKKQQEMRDDTEFQAWRAKMDAKEAEEDARRVAERKAELVAGDENARAARKHREAANLKQTRKDKARMDKERARNAAESAAQLRRRQSEAANLRQDLQEAAERAADTVAAQRRTAAAQARDEERQREQAVAVNLELEKQRKQGLIDEIKAAHGAFVKRQQEQRSTLAARTANATLTGALEGLTIAELRQKLLDTKESHQQWEAAQREKIRGAKSAAQREADERMRFIEAQRQQNRQSKAAARGETVATAAAKASAQERREEQLAVALQAKLQSQREGKKADRDDRRRQERDRRVAAQLMSEDAGAMEALKWAEMERGQQNALLKQQNEALAERRRGGKLHREQDALRERNIAAKEAEREAKAQAQKATFTEKRNRIQQEQAEDEEMRFAATKRIMDEARTMRALTHASAM